MTKQDDFFHLLSWEARTVEEELLKEQGYQPSATRCEGCGHSVFVKVERKPFRWESDVSTTTFRYSCPVCSSHWIERDSD